MTNESGLAMTLQMREQQLQNALDLAAYERGMVKELRASLKDMLKRVDRETCTHEETHRGGVLWTICNQCGKKWADDEGGFVPYAEPADVSQARAVLKKVSV